MSRSCLLINDQMSSNERMNKLKVCFDFAIAIQSDRDRNIEKRESCMDAIEKLRCKDRYYLSQQYD